MGSWGHCTKFFYQKWEKSTRFGLSEPFRIFGTVTSNSHQSFRRVHFFQILKIYCFVIISNTVFSQNITVLSLLEFPFLSINFMIFSKFPYLWLDFIFKKICLTSKIPRKVQFITVKRPMDYILFTLIKKWNRERKEGGPILDEVLD